MLSGKVAVVTGGTRGIGRAVVETFLENGAAVVFFGSRKETVDTAFASLKERFYDVKMEGMYPDLTDEKADAAGYAGYQRTLRSYRYSGE